MPAESQRSRRDGGEKTDCDALNVQLLIQYDSGNVKTHMCKQIL